MENARAEIRPVAREAEEFRPTRNRDTGGDIKPFHEALVPEGVLRTSDFERSFSTSLGTTFEEVARIIGSERFARAERGYKFGVAIPRVALDTIDGIVSDVANEGMKKPYPEHVETVSRAYRGDIVNRRALVIDLFLKSHDNREFYFEMKSPKPNKDSSTGACRKLLTVHGVRGEGPPTVQTFYSMAYNPYGSRTDYAESVARKYLDFENMVLIGEEFWDFVGGHGTYAEVLELYRDVGRVHGPQVWRAITG